jgi:hypothetical protein
MARLSGGEWDPREVINEFGLDCALFKQMQGVADPPKALQAMLKRHCCQLGSVKQWICGCD